MTLRERLRVRALGRPGAGVRRSRERLADFIRSVEDQVFIAPDAATRARLRTLLGWDDDTLAAFIDSPLLAHSSPHTGMNFFAPMFTYAWVLRQIEAAGAVHMRTLVTHNSLGDLRYRPYAWWYRSRDGRVRKHRLYSRSHQERHKVLMALPPPSIDADDLCDSDRQALDVARHARSYAWFGMLYRQSLERAAGFHAEGRMIEVPLNILNAFTFGEESLADWMRAVREVTDRGVRTVNASGEAENLDADRAAEYAANRHDLGGHAILFANAANFAQVYRLGVSAMIGAEKMARYVAPMNADIAEIYRRAGTTQHEPPELIPVTRVPLDQIGVEDLATRSALAEWSIRLSLPIAVADHGAELGRRMERLLDFDYDELYPEAAPLEAQADARTA
jgi:hypothetical protein